MGTTLPLLPIRDPLGRPAVELGLGIIGDGSGAARAPAPLTMLAPDTALAVASAGEVTGRRILLDLTPWTTMAVQANVTSAASAGTRLVLEYSADASTWVELAAVDVDATGLQVGDAVTMTTATIGTFYLRLVAEAAVSLANVYIVPGVGVERDPAPTCDAQLTGLAVNDDTFDDFCAYTSTDDPYDTETGAGSGYEAGKKYTWINYGGNLSLTTDTPWNGNQSLRMTESAESAGWSAGGNTSTFYFTSCAPSAVSDLWVRLRLRFSSGWWPSSGLNTQLVLLELGTYGSNVVQLMVDYSFNPLQVAVWDFLSAPGNDQYTSHYAGDFTDGEWWDFIGHFHKTGSSSCTVDFYYRKADGTGSTTHIAQSVTPTGSLTGELCFGHGSWTEDISVARPGRTYDIGAWEVVDGSAHSNPFGV